MRPRKALAVLCSRSRGQEAAAPRAQAGTAPGAYCPRNASLGGIGVFEGTLVLLLGLAGVDAATAAAVALAARLVEIASWLPGWAATVARERRLLPQREGSPAA